MLESELKDVEELLFIEEKSLFRLVPSTISDSSSLEDLFLGLFKFRLSNKSQLVKAKMDRKANKKARFFIISPH